jgi:molybdopterin/thiamine biosynthesis adenylyltransferase
MVLFLSLAVGLWMLGGFLKASARARWLMIGFLYAAILLLTVVLPISHPLRNALGGSFGEWAVLGGLVALVFGYTQVLGRVKRRAAPVVAKSEGLFQPGELERYARHVIMREIGGLGQKKLKEAKVLVVGAGGLGSPSLLYLAAAGVGTIGVIDDDVVEDTNLQRQVIHSDGRIGMAKVFSAEIAMKAVNPYVTVKPYHRKFDAGIAADLVADYDIVLDGTDNFDTRYLVNAACVAKGVPLVSAAITQWEGQISVFDPANGAPCYACVFPEAPAPGLVPSCAEAGVLGPLPGVMGSMMAVECIKTITGAGEGLRGRMLIYDALYAETRIIKVKRRADCQTCGNVGP